jgi:hypothetical protein
VKPVEFVVPRRFPSVNSWHGGPKWKYAKEADAWLREFPPTTALNRARGRRSVTIIRVYPKAPGQRRYDPDNLRGGAKPILDALVAHGWLKGDSPAHLDLDVVQRHPTPTAGDRPWTIVLIVDAAPSEKAP